MANPITPALPASQVAPRYRNGTRQRLSLNRSRADAKSGPLYAPITESSYKGDPGLWETGNADDAGYNSRQRGQMDGSIAVSGLWRIKDGALPVVEGGEYYGVFTPSNAPGTYEGVVITDVVEVKPSIKGELKWSTTVYFQGPYNTPAEPNTIDDYLAKTGKFAPDYDPTAGKLTRDEAMAAPPAS